MDTDLPTNHPDTFGDAESGNSATGLTAIDVLHAVEPQTTRPRPAVKRLLQGDGANIIAFNFTPGQDLPDHKAAHPITVQLLSGRLDFACDGKRFAMVPGQVLHLRAYVPHAVYCPEDAPERDNVLLLTMLTGERHS